MLFFFIEAEWCKVHWQRMGIWIAELQWVRCLSSYALRWTPKHPGSTVVLLRFGAWRNGTSSTSRSFKAGREPVCAWPVSTSPMEWINTAALSWAATSAGNSSTRENTSRRNAGFGLRPGNRRRDGALRRDRDSAWNHSPTQFWSAPQAVIREMVCSSGQRRPHHTTHHHPCLPQLPLLLTTLKAHGQLRMQCSSAPPLPSPFCLEPSPLRWWWIRLLSAAHPSNQLWFHFDETFSHWSWSPGREDWNRC